MRCIVLSVLLTTFTTFFTGCKKDSTATNNPITGSWELVKEQSGRTPAINYNAGNGNILKFTHTNYEAFANGQLKRNGTYMIVHDTSADSELCLVLPADQYQDRIIYDGDTTHKVFMQISRDTLSFLSGCFASDAGVYQEYVRQ